MANPAPKPCDFQHLPTTLSRLEVVRCPIWNGDQLSVSPSSTPWLTELTGLQHLRLTVYMEVEPSVLSSLITLTHLDMENVTLISEDNAATKSFLSILPCFMELRHLSLPGTLKWSTHHNYFEPKAFSSLLSSTGLTCLDIHQCALPDSVVQHMFQDQLTALQVLRIAPDTDRLSPIDTHDDLQRLVQCCPSLQELCLVRAINRNLRLTPLGQISNLTSLTLGGRCMQSIHAMEDIVSSGLQLTLKQLTLRSIPSLVPMNLLCLRQLTKLTRLRVSGCEYTNEEIGHINLSSKVSCSLCYCHVHCFSQSPQTCFGSTGGGGCLGTNI